jgi:hypothetical protein
MHDRLVSRFVVVLAALLFLAACSALRPGVATPAVVTGIASGRASAPGEMVYGLRTASGRVYFVSQRLSAPLKEGDTVDIEVNSQGQARIRER